MSAEKGFTKSNLDSCLSVLAKEFRKLNGTSMPAEIILIGGASVLANYGFRNMTYDVDAIIHASSSMKEAINRTGDKLGLPNGWLNTDFTKTKSYSHKLTEVSVPYKTFSKILTIRTVDAEYLIAMKLMSGRQYKNDMSDIAGIMSEHQKSGKPIAEEVIKSAVEKLYGKWEELPQSSQNFMRDMFNSENYEAIYSEALLNEKSAKNVLLDFQEKHPDALNEDNIDSVIEKAKQKREPEKKTLLSRLNEKKELVKNNEKSQQRNRKSRPEL
jgi:hypothetical protein